MLHVLDQLDSGGVELALSTLTDGGDRFKCVGLLEDEYVAILSNDHPVAAETDLSIERFAALPHDRHNLQWRRHALHRRRTR